MRKIDGLPSHRARFRCKLFPAFFINAKAVSILAKSRNFAYSAIPICNPGPSQILKRNGCLPYIPALCLSKGKADELFLRKHHHLRIGSRKVGGLVLQKTPPFAE
ncbi:hypothetical protein KIY57_11510 [Heyndrickxia coagulans]|nr:hypothetical protein KIY57_11510 [Heyndrickxia coagulans]